MPATLGASAALRSDDLAARLSGQGGEEVQLRALRELKNQIIGSRAKKLLYLRLGAVPGVVAALAEPDASPPVLVQAAAAAGSFACGIEDGIVALLDAGAVPVLTRLLSHPDDKVLHSGARALKMIYQSKIVPKYDVLQDKNMTFLISLLNSEKENVTELAANIIAHSCKINTEQMALCNSGILDRLVSLFGGFASQRDACLEAISAIVRNNMEAASKFASMDNGKAFGSLVRLMQDRNPRTRLLACLCLIAVGHASPIYFQDVQTKASLVKVLLDLLDEPGLVGDEVPSAFMALINGSEELHKLALSVSAVEKLRKNMHNSPIEAKRLEGILLALAELCSKLEEARSRLMSIKVSSLDESLKQDNCDGRILPAAVSDALKHENAGVRVAACTCIRNISRSIKNLSSGAVSKESIMVQLTQLLYDQCAPVQVAALGALCNLAVNLTPRKTAFFQYGLVPHLVQLVKSMDAEKRLKSVWTLRNLMFLLDLKGKECVLKELGLSTLSSLICDSEHAIQEQALGLVINLLDGLGDTVKYVFEEDNAILNAISRQLKNTASVVGVHTQGMLVLTNVAAGKETEKEAVMDLIIPAPTESSSPSVVIRFLQSKNKSLRLTTLWCILNLVSPECDGSAARFARLQESGAISQVSSMINDPCQDCKFRVKSVLEHRLHFEAAENT